MSAEENKEFTVRGVPFVCIKKSEYDSLLDDLELLNALRAAGVDNWEGYDEACRIYRNGDIYE